MTNKAQHTKGRLYYHKTDGGAEYLCAGCINDNANAADLGTAVARLDGTPELFPLYAAAPEMYQALLAFQEGLRDGSIRWAKPRQADSDPYHKANTLACEAIAKAEGRE